MTFTFKEYADKACEANSSAKALYVFGTGQPTGEVDAEGNELKDGTLVLADYDYYVSTPTQYGNITDGTLNSEYLTNKFNEAKTAKYTEINSGYDNACKYGISPISFTLNQAAYTYYANRSWIDTWNEVIAGLETVADTTVFVRLYTLQSNGRYKNVTLSGVTCEQYKALRTQLINYRFNTLQVHRDTKNALLAAAKTLDDLEAITVNFGTTINEQDLTDVNAKLDLI